MKIPESNTGINTQIELAGTELRLLNINIFNIFRV